MWSNTSKLPIIKERKKEIASRRKVDKQEKP